MRAGIIPTLLGTAVTGATLYMNGEDIVKRGKRKRNVESMVASGLLGFGVAHLVLGSINMMKKQ
ncbi:MAG: asparagine synthase [Tissierellia bacterium]|nr:asparagine synthase [Tissierellia bacterium]MDD4726817.1 asparagine synthase [Tissierellia bacterium]